MFESLKVSNYRGFQECSLSNLTRVNLLVGRNNSGKSSLLEVIHLLAASGDPDVLLTSCIQRGEQDLNRYTERTYQAPVDVSHLFHGHDAGLGRSFLIDAGSEGRVKVSIEPLPSAPDFPALFPDDGQMPPPVYMLKVISTGGGGELAEFQFPVSEGGTLPADTRRFTRRSPATDIKDRPKTRFIGPNSMAPRGMALAWNEVLAASLESDVIEAMRILQPDLKEIVFLAGDAPFVRNQMAGILVSLNGKNKRNPLGTFGDGMRRMLALAIAMVTTRGGVLLVDEIDNGFHYSVMADMWTLVIQAAEKFDMQVFATTHNRDCLNGLADACKKNKNFRDEISVQKIDRTLEKSVPFDGDEVLKAVKYEIELR